VIKRVEKITEQENNFRRLVALKGMRIQEIEGDGNCMFRAVSDQVYNGNQTHFKLIRQFCLDYIENEKDFFV
jgi:OTU domain-containing protein 5